MDQKLDMAKINKYKYKYCRSICWGPSGNKEKDIFESPYYDKSSDAEILGKKYVDHISASCPNGRNRDWITKDLVEIV